MDSDAKKTWVQHMPQAASSKNAPQTTLARYHNLELNLMAPVAAIGECGPYEGTPVCRIVELLPYVFTATVSVCVM